MNWHTSTTTSERLGQLISEIRHQGGTIFSCQRSAVGLVVTWFTV